MINVMTTWGEKKETVKVFELKTGQMGKAIEDEGLVFFRHKDAFGYILNSRQNTYFQMHYPHELKSSEKNVEVEILDEDIQIQVTVTATTGP